MLGNVHRLPAVSHQLPAAALARHSCRLPGPVHLQHSWRDDGNSQVGALTALSVTNLPQLPEKSGHGGRLLVIFRGWNRGRENVYNRVMPVRPPASPTSRLGNIPTANRRQGVQRIANREKDVSMSIGELQLEIQRRRGARTGGRGSALCRRHKPAAALARLPSRLHDVLDRRRRRVGDSDGGLRSPGVGGFRRRRNSRTPTGAASPSMT